MILTITAIGVVISLLLRQPVLFIPFIAYYFTENILVLVALLFLCAGFVLFKISQQNSQKNNPTPSNQNDNLTEETTVNEREKQQDQLQQNNVSLDTYNTRNSDDSEDDNIDLWIPQEFKQTGNISEINDENLKIKTLEKLDKLIGMDELKKEVRKLINFVEVEKKKAQAGLKTENITLHMTFLGDPGTGKTFVARIIGELLKAVGYLDSGHFIETDRSGLVAGYVGQTAEKVEKMVAKAENGVLFIDEAYSLAGSSQGTSTNDYGKEAVDTLIKLMDDKRDKLVVILAGYENDMKQLFNMNPGFKSRVPFHFHFPNYSASELLKIAQLMIKEKGLYLSETAEKNILIYFNRLIETHNCVPGNARTVRNLIDQLRMAQSTRIIETNSDDYLGITAEDVINAVEVLERVG